MSWLLLLLGLAAAGQAWALPQHRPIPGGVAIVELGVDGAQRPQVSYLGNPVMLNHGNKGWQAIVGIPLATRAGTQHLSLTTAQGKRELAFQVTSKKYASQYLQLKNKRMVDPTAEDLVRIAAEGKLIRAAFRQWSEDYPIPEPLLQPTQGIRSSSFGLRRFFNQQPRKPHSGMDIAAPEGQKVINPARGRVVAIGDYFFNGKTVFIDHGQGLISMFCHLSDIRVQPGQELQRGDEVAAVGMSGRVTGPHLHWSLSLNNARIDPELFLQARQ